jgi:hypothetical protein
MAPKAAAKQSKAQDKAKQTARAKVLTLVNGCVFKGPLAFASLPALMYAFSETGMQ